MNKHDTDCTAEFTDEIIVRVATLNDLDFLEQLEKKVFPAHRQSSRKSLRNSIKSSNQVVFVVELKNENGLKSAGSSIAFLYKHTMRIYSISVEPDFRGRGIGELQIQKLTEYAGNLDYESISLEVDSFNIRLVDWYKKFGFEIIQHLADYYADGEPAYRMIKKLQHFNQTLQPFIIVSNVISNDILNKDDYNNIYTPEEYLTGEKFSRLENCRVINLCKSYRTHSVGYYVSLLATARNHKITPSIMAIKDISNLQISQSILDEIPDSVKEQLMSTAAATDIELTIIFGHTTVGKFNSLAKKFYELFEVPFISVTLELKKTLKVKAIRLLSPKYVISNHLELFKVALTELSKKKRYKRTRLKTYKYDLAILVNSNEKTPPSCPLALQKFRMAAEKIGFFVEFITKSDFRRICEFDALFIRETTAVESHTYSMARNAYTEGLVVIDDPWSILLCSNKIYLYERLKNAGVCQPKSWLFSKQSFSTFDTSSLVFPLVLKLPESSFSLGVYCANNLQEFNERIKEMFTQSAMVIAQEFLKSDYDWRIGILDNSPIFACKYYMANDHWQIYNWNPDNKDEFSGKSETLPINQVPVDIIKLAVKATSLIGDGLYGVDLKYINGKAYIIEINDNPNIDVGVEDDYLGDDLYINIMNSIYNRIEVARKKIRYLV